ncbi:MAG: Rrf2 family transcriptional regulator [Candidatus Aureabacteria bacterium]|nr:Rrf2 family transcriptional regulator [Candidatus Auribacterota bacterium]
MAKLIKVSEAAALALHAMVLMAADRRKPLSTHDAAARLKVSEAHLSKVFQRLTKDGLVRSFRGPQGGFVLGRSPDDLSLLDVYESIEGKCEESNCLFDVPACDGKKCILGGIMKKVDGQLRRYLARAKLAALAGKYKGRSGI